ncbi:hypothetical protein MARPO_0017s0013 [Marchantia polymorpha]|uniref:Uncharacterized protein n=1 Tax=Marchantia polymorpha TaxID=3197 RepID=A0A2R6XFK7_MARPO|nr:hypothetical protein MARPO_0017s0013 [Marchantia polymorpha]|eukprot:PTQ44888.1 hypothetical protein MARPO_0017s0013 [Marchantia polymorpha]
MLSSHAESKSYKRYAVARLPPARVLKFLVILETFFYLPPSSQDRYCSVSRSMIFT